MDKTAIIDEAKLRLQLCQSADDADRAEALIDMHFIAGEQWDAESIRQRDLDGRPHLTNNNLPAIVHQVTNDVRQNRQSIHVHPVDNSGDIEVAEVIEGLIRHIEYDSSADAAYDTALNSAVSGGFGFFRLVTEYCAPDSFDQDIKIKRVRNPFTIYVDPNAQEADASDMRFAFVTSKVSKEEFKRDYPKAESSYDSIVPGIVGGENWIGTDYVRICEYYRIEEEPCTYVRMSDGSVMEANDKGVPAPGVVPVATRKSFKRKVMWYKLTALDVLESAEVPFDWIPVFPVYGDELDIDGTVQRIGLVRNARDPIIAFNYWMTAATEEIAMRTKTPFIGAIGQFEGVEEDWDAANNRSFARLEYNPVTIDGSMAPAPQRQPMADTPSGNIAMMMLARDNVKAVTGIYDASLGNRSNETSGIAIKARQHQGDVGNFHFSDNLTRAIRHMGRCIVSGIPRIYDTERVIRVLGHDGKAETTPVNQPMNPPEVDEQTGAIKTILNNLTVGKYDVVVSTGPAYNTLRSEAADSMIQMAQAYPMMMQVAGDKVVRSMDWPDAQDIADRIEKTLPPGLADKKDDKSEPEVQTPNGPIPIEQAGQMIGQMDQTLSQMHEDMTKLESGMAQAQLDADTRIEVAKINAAAKHDDTELKGMVQILIAKMDAAQSEKEAAKAAVDAGAAMESKAPTEAKEDPNDALKQMLAALTKPKRKTMRIMAPSGAVYHGEVADSEDDQASEPVEQGIEP